MKSGKTTESRSTTGKSPRKSAAARNDPPAPAVAVAKPRRMPAPKRPAVAPKVESSDGPVRPTREEREVLIARIAYFRAESRGFVPGHELDDWYAAEAEIEAQRVEDR